MSAEDFCRLSLDDFVSGSEIKYDIYVRLSEAKFVRIAHSGQDITVERIKGLKEKGISDLYLSQRDFRDYVGFNTRLARLAANSPAISREKKLNLLRHTGEIVAASVFSEVLSGEGVAEAKSMVETAVQLLSDDRDAFTLIEQLRGHSEGVYAHSVAVAFYGALLARKMGWSSTPTLVKVSLGGLFHDIGYKDVDQRLLGRPASELTDEERLLLDSHVTRGATLLSELQERSGDLVQIAMEHHENCAGTGFPRRLKRSRIHPLAKLISLVDVFCEYALGFGGTRPDGPAHALERLRAQNSERFESEMLRTMVSLVKTK